MTRQAVRFHKFGIDHLQSETIESPPLGPNDLRVRPSCVSLNYRDLLMVKGYYNPKLAMPLIPLSDGVGEVLEVGSEVTQFRRGDRVCSTMIPDWDTGTPSPNILHTTLGGPVDGMFSTEVVLPQQAFLKVPERIDTHTAACLPVAGLTAWTSLVEFGAITSESKILLLGTGGVSIMALSIARALGAKVAITSSSDEKLERAKALGAEVGINYRTHPNWWQKVLEWAPHGVDLVVEVGGAGTFNQSVKAVKTGGKIALIGVLAQANDPIQLVSVLMKNICVQGVLVGHREAFERYLQFVAQHSLQAVVDKVFNGLTSAKEAFTYMAQARHFSKIVVDLDS